MQESGISKRVSVRFEDVSEDGHIHQDAIEREQASDSNLDGKHDEEADPSDDDTQAA